jgi:nucleoside-diphosphate-sugar epimerase
MTPPFKVVVTGAGGFVGGSVVQALLEAGATVVAVDRTFGGAFRRAWERWGDRAQMVESEVAEMPPVEADAIVHGAAVTALPDEAGHSPEENFRANLMPALDALEWAKRQGARRFVFLSSSAVYRDTAPGPVSETLPASPLGVYAVAKYATESLIETLRAVYGRDAAVARLSNIYGPAERARPTRPRLSLVGRMIRAALENGALVVYRDDPARDWTYAPDVGRAIHRLLTCPVLPHYLYHVASGQTLTPVEIAEMIQSLLPHVRLDVRAGADPDAAPLTRRGTLSAERLRQEVGFDDWTAFEDGIAQIIDRERQLEQAG